MKSSTIDQQRPPKFRTAQNAPNELVLFVVITSNTRRRCQQQWKIGRFESDEKSDWLNGIHMFYVHAAAHSSIMHLISFSVSNIQLMWKTLFLAETGTIIMGRVCAAPMEDWYCNLKCISHFSLSSIIYNIRTKNHSAIAIHERKRATENRESSRGNIILFYASFPLLAHVKQCNINNIHTYLIFRWSSRRDMCVCARVRERKRAVMHVRPSRGITMTTYNIYNNHMKNE